MIRSKRGGYWSCLSCVKKEILSIQATHLSSVLRVIYACTITLIPFRCVYLAVAQKLCPVSTGVVMLHTTRQWCCYILWSKKDRPNEKGQKDKQRSTNITHKTKDRVTRTPLKTGDELRCSGRVMSFPCWLLRCLKPVLYVYLRKSIGIGIEIMGLFARILNLIAITLWSINLLYMSRHTSSLVSHHVLPDSWYYK
jgi:hypothetical protein